MTNAELADRQNQFTSEPDHITRATVLKVFAIIAVVSLILRIFYAGHLYEDDGLWFTAGEEILRGKALYREVYFDKPPGLALAYALLFWLFGAHIITVRLFTIVYSVAISGALYLFGTWLYGKRVGLWAAALFAVFSTTYATGHMQGFGTDLLMALPYTAGAYLLVRSRGYRGRALDGPTGQAWRAMAGGALVGVAFQINPKAIFDLIFYAIFLIASRRWSRSSTARADTTDEQTPESPDGGSHSTRARAFGPRLFAIATSGFIAGSLPFLVYIATSRSFRSYWSYVWDWGARYGSYYGAGKTVLSALTQSADYFTLNNTLSVALIFLAAITVRRGFNRATNASQNANRATGASFTARSTFEHDATLLMWFAVSYLGVMAGGRFFAHYFIQILPSLCVIGARGLTGILAFLHTRRPSRRRGVIALIAIGFAFTLVRFHGRTVLLAADFARGTVSESNSAWYYSMRNREERLVAAVVRDLPEEAADRLGLEAITAGGPRARAADGPSDYVFVWGYRPEIYYWAGLLPASRYLSTQPLTGVPADVHYFGGDYRSILDERVTSEARAELARDLEETPPKYIVDEIGFFNADLAILKYRELEAVMSEYKAVGSTGRFLIYVRKELRKKYLLRHPPKEP